MRGPIKEQYLNAIELIDILIIVAHPGYHAAY